MKTHAEHFSKRWKRFFRYFFAAIVAGGWIFTTYIFSIHLRTAPTQGFLGNYLPDCYIAQYKSGEIEKIDIRACSLSAVTSFVPLISFCSLIILAVYYGKNLSFLTIFSYGVFLILFWTCFLIFLTSVYKFSGGLS